MFKCNVVYGADVEPFESDTPIRVGDLRRNEDLKATLGFGDNVNILIGGIAMPDEALVPPGAQVVIETAANRKALELAVA